MSLLILGQIVIALLAFCACECNLCAHDFHLHLIDVGVLLFCESSLPHRWVRPSPQNYGEAGRQRRQPPRVGVNSLPHRTPDFTDPGCHIRPEADIISPHKKEEPWFFHSLLRIARGNARVNRLFRYFCLSSCRITIPRSTTAIPAVWSHSRQPAGIPCLPDMTKAGRQDELADRRSIHLSGRITQESLQLCRNQRFCRPHGWRNEGPLP